MIKSNKTKRVNLRVTEKEYQKIVGKAKKANLSTSRYVSLSALDKEIIFFDDIKRMNHELSKIGNNLNQLTVLAHQGKIKEVNLTKTREAFSGLWDELCKLVKRKG
ncbi:MobC family plasmid mobilization relaxosome protein [Alkaliphilus serpentinus]|uniref:MobC family plasmid mobilization relaxosome protein n=1 Tax=Alkaliphilus serpentinus TaxID=1482731 RepID=A0A833HM23_9FIRM|nr:MobC family plasmid mobilization relaxosome protein [Alkaliphilus serpentinus]KAB3527098.1 MobC family plasmid mobilization relaxosome protein [Alkaliphilus serpentinus]